MTDNTALNKTAEPRVSWTDRLKRDVEFFHTKTGMKYSTIGNKSIRNARFWDKINNGGTITLESADLIYQFMESQGYIFPNS
jgi:hypothetical protein